jgi:hypothetical protein
VRLKTVGIEIQEIKKKKYRIAKKVLDDIKETGGNLTIGK